MLRLGDCYAYGFKNLQRDQKKAEQLYADAAELGLPEACTLVAYLTDEKVIRELNDEIMLHSNVTSSPNYHLIWRHLEKAAELKYVSPFMIKWLVEAKRHTQWKMSKNMEKILANFKTECEAEIRSEKASYKFSCRSSRCDIMFNQELAMLECGQCLLVMS
jgi:TPR repeat protein